VLDCVVRQSANLPNQMPKETPKLAPHEPEVNVGQIQKFEKSTDDVKTPPPLAVNGTTNFGSSQPAAKKSVLRSFVNVTMPVRVALITLFCMLVGLGGNGMISPIDNRQASLSTSFGQATFIPCNVSTKQRSVDE
jgi:hypothetical protein